MEEEAMSPLDDCPESPESSESCEKQMIDIINSQHHNHHSSPLNGKNSKLIDTRIPRVLSLSIAEEACHEQVEQQPKVVACGFE
ncbi:hypothetical protein RUM43_013100 [Polyplax serrata]|uniref:Uncharacterized protein n=1 Tax=Polyplax serrata TaxID=468196 RepID=A0AAN8S777_POLSC